MPKSNVAHHEIDVEAYERQWFEMNAADDNWARRQLRAHAHRARSMVAPRRCNTRHRRARSVRTPRKTTGDPDPEPESGLPIFGTFATANDCGGAL